MATAEGSSSQVTYDHIFKIILIGDNGVGKSSFIRRFCEGSYVANMETTVGVDFYLSEIDINGKKIKVKIWDTAGSEKYMSISAVYYRKADGVVFVFDVTKPRSFTNIETIWMNAVDAPESGCPEAIKLLVGNKCDLPAEVDLSQAKRYAELHDMLFLEASAKNNHNVRECFLHLAREICELKAQQQPQTFPNADLTPSIKLKQSYPVERESQKEGGGGGCSC
ncbi:Ras-related protein Rab-1A [Geodia barretti]|uniref:Ras-related protein Rab-1A n=1 Tax=Geodia barretti TaxID=519541 RepID=A0AA35W5I3_GEOBA|nr:Ras-related protein Rab-1A [Geodia barretti]